MYKKLNGLLNLVLVFIFVVSAYPIFSNKWIAKDINRMQMKYGQSSGYYPMLTFCLLIVVPAVVL